MRKVIWAIAWALGVLTDPLVRWLRNIRTALWDLYGSPYEMDILEQDIKQLSEMTKTPTPRVSRGKIK